MKFVCSNCKAKYQIADEKIQGRTLKMDCRRCNTAITIRGDLPQQVDDVEMEADVPAARAPSRRPGAAAGGSSVGAAPSRPRSAAATGSLAGHPSPSSLGADFRRGSIAPESRPEARTSVLDQWHVAINDVPVGPMRREEVSRKIATGAVTAESLAWREGFDDWRPVRDIPELAALLRKAEPLPNRSMPGPRGATGAGARLAAASPSRLGGPRPAAASSTAAAARAGNVVPIGGRHGGAAPAIEEFESLEGEGDQDEATQVASAADLGLLALTSKPEAKATPKAPEKPKAPERRDPTGPAKVAPPRPKNDVFAKPVAAAPAAPVAAPEPIDDGLPPLVSPSLPPAEPVAAAPAAAFAPAPIAPAPAPVAVSTPPEEKRRRGLPVGAWMGIAGAMAFGVVFALMAAQRMFPAASTAPATAAVVPPPATPTGPVEAPLEIDPVVEAPPETPPVAEVAPETPPETPPTAPTGGGGHSTGRTTTGSSGSSGSSTGSGSTGSSGSAALSPDFARLADDTTGPRTINSEATRRSLGDSASTSGSELTSEQISHVVTRERAGLQRCWETAIRGMRETPTVRMDIDLTIGSSGTVTAASARGPSVGTLTDCIERSVRRWRFPSSSGTSRTSFPIVFSGTS